jgi:hypothetical protein
MKLILQTQKKNNTNRNNCIYLYINNIVLVLNVFEILL